MSFRTNRGLNAYLSGRSRIESIGPIINRYMKNSGLGAALRHREIHEVWQSAVGPESTHTRLVGVRGATLEVEVESSALMQDLEMKRHNLLAALQAEVAKPFVSRIHFRLGDFGSEEHG